MRIGVYLPNWIGDVVMATPTLRVLREHFGESAEIVGIMRPYVAEVLRGTLWLNDTIFLDRKSKDRNVRPWHVMPRLRRRNFDKLLLLTNSLSTGIIGWLSGAQECIGYARYGRGMFLTTKLSPPRTDGVLDPISAVDYYLELARAVGCRPKTKTVELHVSTDDQSTAQTILSELGIDRRRPLILMNNSGGHGSARLWPNEYFAMLSRQVADELDANILVLCGPKECETAREITSRANHERVTSLANFVPTIGPLKAIIRQAKAIVSTDSGPRHLAAALQIPTVALLGPIHPRWTVNYSPVETHIYKGLSCSPCGKSVCPLGHHRCMRDITPSEALYALRRLLNSTHRAAA